MDRTVDLKKKPAVEEEPEEKFERFGPVRSSPPIGPLGASGAGATSNGVDHAQGHIQTRAQLEEPLGRVDEEGLITGSQSRLQGDRGSSMINSSGPVQVAWSGLLRDYSPNMRAIAIFAVILFGVGTFFIFFQKNIFATAFFFAASIFLLASAKKKPPEADFVVGPLSVKVGPSEHAFKDIKSFWVEYNPEGTKELSLQLKKWYLPYLKIPLHHQNPVQIRMILLKFIPEVEHEDTILNVLERVLGF